MANKNLNKAKEAKKDEFYTQLEDINNELRHYREHFRGKTVLCNCDDPRVSNFFKYFAYNFEFLGLKKLIATCYKSQDANLFSEGTSEQAVYLVYEGDKNGNNIPDDEEIEVLPLKGDGDFRSTECIEFLKESDIVVTNPPFSLFREYVTQLVKYDKKFLIIGNMNAISTKEIFPLFMNNQVWFGASIHSGDRKFWVPDDYELDAAGCGVDETGRKYIRVKGVRWYTNLDYKERNEDLILYKSYNPDDYPTYENYDAIDVSKTSDIPMDYFGKMGVPISFLDKYNPFQFEILGIANGSELGVECGISSNLNESEFRSLVKENSNLRRGKVCYRDKNGKLQVLYNRIIIRRKQ
ncbi:adenine-specific methyltransferase EcoRI family protein [Bacteroides acidifaciens]|uniref:adenine-specific methyltransferase EcoRI family protein n=2 Tax=Bacteroidales TaxID=171549 RepID=UPI002586E14E|nr:adenine-specific methyltransferase EcoRI family protein [Bacteroides acidifaciens]